MNSVRSACRLSVILLLVIFTNVAVVQAQDAKKPGAIGRLVDWLLDKPEPDAVEVEAFEVPMMAVAAPVAKSELKKRAARLVAWSAAMRDWTSRVAKLSDEQKETLTEINSKVVEQAIDGPGAKVAPNNRIAQQQGFGDHFVINFTAPNGLAKSVDLTGDLSKLVFVKLTEKQKADLETAVKERRKFFQDANVGYILNLIDAELCLTEKQRDESAKIIRGSIDLDAACYAMQPMNYYFQQTSIATLFSNNAVRKLLTDSQKLRSSDSGNQTQQSIMFKTNDGMDAWQDQLATVIRQQKGRLRRAADVRVDFEVTSAGLDEKDRRYLRVASKGAIEDVIKTWKTQTRQQLDSWGERAAGQFAGRNVSFGVTAADVKQFEKNKLWSFTVESLTEGKTTYSIKRDGIRSEAWARFVVAMIDKELWLSTSQREEMLKCVAAVMPPADYEVQNARYFREVGLLVIPLFKLSKRDLAFLTPAQKTAWDELKKPFQHQGNYVLVQMKNGGSMHLTIPK